MMTDNISFIGLGKLGLPLATNFAKNGVKVLAIDINKKNIDLLKQKISPFFEPNLQQNINESFENISFSTENTNITNTDMTVVLVNTPSKEDGSFSNEYIFNCLENICESLLKNKKTKHDFIISSTVMPGSFSTFIKFIEQKMSWKLNKQFSLAYVPDFVALGNVVKDFENPDMLIVGCSNEQFGEKVSNLYKRQLKNNCKVCFMTLEEAEIAKVSLNAYICTKISFANFLANFCEKTPNTNVDNITNAIGIDKRISPYYFKGALSFGGTCFPRDTWAFIKASEKVGLNAEHIKSAQNINLLQDESLLQKILLMPEKKVSIFGLGFKNNTPVITEASSIKLISELLKRRYEIHVYDPIEEAQKNTQEMFGNSIKYYNNFIDCFLATKQLVIINPYKEFKILEEKVTEQNIILDCWRAFNFKKATVITIGVGK